MLRELKMSHYDQAYRRIDARCFVLPSILLGALVFMSCDTPMEALCGPNQSFSGSTTSATEVNCGSQGELPKISDAKLYTCGGEEQTIMGIVSTSSSIRATNHAAK